MENATVAPQPLAFDGVTVYVSAVIDVETDPVIWPVDVLQVKEGTVDAKFDEIANREGLL